MSNPTNPCPPVNALQGQAGRPIELRSPLSFLNEADAAAFVAALIAQGVLSDSLPPSALPSQVAYVSSAHGNDGTGVIGNPWWRFATVAAAVTAGATIVRVLGSTAENITWAAGTFTILGPCSFTGTTTMHSGAVLRCFNGVSIGAIQPAAGASYGAWEIGGAICAGTWVNDAAAGSGAHNGANGANAAAITLNGCDLRGASISCQGGSANQGADAAAASGGSPAIPASCSLDFSTYDGSSGEITILDTGATTCLDVTFSGGTAGAIPVNLTIVTNGGLGDGTWTQTISGKVVTWTYSGDDMGSGGGTGFGGNVVLIDSSPAVPANGLDGGTGGTGGAGGAIVLSGCIRDSSTSFNLAGGTAGAGGAHSAGEDGGADGSDGAAGNAGNAGYLGGTDITGVSAFRSTDSGERANTTTAADDDVLIAHIPSKGRWHVQCNLVGYCSDASAGLFANFAFTGGKTAEGGWCYASNWGSYGFFIAWGSQGEVFQCPDPFGTHFEWSGIASSWGEGATNSGIYFDFFFTADGPGVLSLQWAQAYSSSTPTILQAGSKFSAVKVGQ